jgi:NitT/TauT family transport system ATP-binding protein
MKALLQVRGAGHRYTVRDGNTVNALRGLDFDIEEGEFIAVVGASGCGKSTLLRLLCGTLGCSEGFIEMRGRPVDGPREDIAPVFQRPVLLPWRTVLDNLLLPLELKHDSRGGAWRAPAEARARDYLASAGLGGSESRYPHELSGGMQQRVAIGRALMRDPALLLMDEPFGALDAMTRERMQLDLLDLWAARRMTVVLVTHSIAEAVFLADRVFVLGGRPGRLLDVVEVDLPRPRHLELMHAPEFGAHVARIRRQLDLQGVAA